MKNNQIFKIIMVFVAIFSLIACDNEPLEGEFADGSINPGINANFQVDIDGITFTADQSAAQTSNGYTIISGAKVDGELVLLSIEGAGTGTFPLTTNGGSAMYQMAGDSIPFNTNFEGMTGEVTITDYNLTDMAVSGTFAFTASRTDSTDQLETKEFTNGTFSGVPLQSDATPPPNTDYYINFTYGDTDYSFEASTADSMKRLVRGEEMENDTLTMISLWMPLDVAVGSYTFTDAPGGDLEAYTANFTAMADNLDIDATDGTLEITTISEDSFEGTFNFLGTDENGNVVEVINGEFKAPNL